MKIFCKLFKYNKLLNKYLVDVYYFYNKIILWFFWVALYKHLKNWILFLLNSQMLLNSIINKISTLIFLKSSKEILKPFQKILKRITSFDNGVCCLDKLNICI